jgi:hypothetical protein
MDLNILNRLSKHLEHDTLSFFYQGSFGDQFTDKIISLSEYNIANVNELAKSRRKVSFLMAECFQNVVRHSTLPKDIEDTESQIGFFATRNIGSSFYITSANLIENSEVERLRESLNQVNSLNKEELKKLYLEVLTEGGFSEKGGAGLGLVEMARKSGQPLQFDFKKVNDRLSYYYLQIKMKGKIDMPADQMTSDVSLKTVKKLHLDLIRENIQMIYKGDFSPDSILPVLKMIEENVTSKAGRSKMRKRVYMTAVELLQNISQHSKIINNSQDGIFMISKDLEGYMITTGNLIDNQQIDSLKTRLNRINGLSARDLTILYKKTLLGGAMSTTEDTRLGLIDVARDVVEPMEYGFDSVNTTTSFFSLNVKI